ncbi:MAG: insulinase family protein [Candidatus Levybacteria bacterium]|nr:insulinase family protein [Candidatus Levybacteria bacterium]
MNYTRTVSPNGLRVITVPMPSLESATVLVMVGAGSRYEDPNNTGISHFLEHMAFKGTEKRPSALDISSLIDGMGGEFNAFTGKEYTGYYIKSSKNNINVSLDVLSDMLQHSKLDPTEINKEKGVILEEKNLYEDTPMRNIGDIYEQLLYGDTPMGWDVIGTKEVIQGMTREQFLAYMQSLYSSHNMTVVMAGSIDEEKGRDLVDEYFNPMKKFAIKNPEPVKEDQKKPDIKIKEKKTEQVHIALGVRTVSIDSDHRHSLSVLAAIMGGGMSSRLFNEVREKRGLGYYVRSSSDHYKDAGTLVSMAGIDPKRVTEAIETILAEYRKAREGVLKVSKDELKKAKEYLKGHLVLELEDSRAVAGYYGHQELLEKEILNPDQVIAKIDAVTTEDIDRVGKAYFQNSGLNLALIGNFADRQRLEDLLRL